MIPKTTVLLFYTDGEESSGLGHLRRSEALAYSAKMKGWDPIFLYTGPVQAAWLSERGWMVSQEEPIPSSTVAAIVIDSYLISKKRIQAYKKRYKRLVGFHDYGDVNGDFALVISSVYTEERISGTAHVLAGAKYKIIHPDVLSVHKASVGEKVSHIVVTFGGDPAMKELAQTVQTSLEKEFPEVAVKIVMGMPGDEAAKAFAGTDIAVSGGGQTIFEFMYLGVPSIIVILGADQKGQVREAEAHNVVQVAGVLGDAGLNKKIAESVRKLYSIETRRQFSASASGYIDGSGAGRIMAAVEHHFMKESRRITIGNREIGDGREPFIIAEAGINHNGELKKAIEMISVAKKAGADAIKFQTFKAEEFVGDPSQQFTYQSQGKEVTESMLEMFKRYELSREEWFALKKECDNQGILFISTPQNRTDLDLLLEIGVPAVKVGSDDFTNVPLLKSYAKTKLPLIISCGMSYMAEVGEAFKAVGTAGGYPTILLVCTSEYPTPVESVNILRVRTFRDAYPEVPIGFSDHTQGSLASTMAVALGACIFEKHFTLDRSLPGPDHWFSEDPETLVEWINAIRTSSLMRGTGIVEPTTVERQNKVAFQRVIVAARNIVAGRVYSEEDFMMRRMSEKGLAPRNVEKLVGRKASQNYRMGEIIRL